MTSVIDEAAVAELEPAPVDKQPGEDVVDVVPHRHVWSLVSTLSGLREAQRALAWDIASSRIVGINRCSDCGELHRGSVRECKVRHCRTHPICEGLSG